MPRQCSARTNIRIPSACSLFISILAVLTILAAAAIAQNPVPFLDQPLVPDAVSPGGPAFTLTVNGSGFVASSTVNWNRSPLTTTFVSSAQLTASVPASDIAAASTAAVTVVNPTPGGGVSNIQYFSIAMAAASASFQPVELYDSSKYVNYSSVAIADLNGDGKPDLVVTSQNMNSTGDGSVQVFLGNGDGTFQAPVAYDSGSTNPGSLAISDMNGDGKLDIVVGNGGNPSGGSGGVGVLLGNGDGTFQPALLFSLGGIGAGGPVAIADVNGDGKPDVVAANCCQGGHNVAVLLGNGDGTLQPPAFYSSGGSGAFGVSSIVLADLRGNGKLDLLVANYCGNNLYCPSVPVPEGSVGVLLGNGDGTFQPAVAYDSGDKGAESVAVGDVSGDGRPDLLVGHCGYNGCNFFETGVVGVLLGNGDGTFQPASTYPGGDSISSMAVADVNMDGKLDIVVANMYPLSPAESDGAVSVLLGNGDGTFQLPLTSDAGALWSVAVAVADVNGDGKPDAVVVNDCDSWCVPSAINSSVGVLLNDSGSVQTPTTTTVSSSLNPAIYGQTVTLSSAVSSASGLPTGTVTFYQGSTAVGNSTLVNRSTSISVSMLVAGSQPITAVYQGCSAFGSSTSTQLSQIVSPETTTTAMTSSANPARPGKRITFTATVASQFSGAITGSVTFLAGSQDLGTIPLSGNRSSVTTSFASTGTYSVSATYNGDANNLGSMSTLSQDIDATTTTTLSSSLNPSTYGQEVPFTATVTSSSGAPPDGETVSFMQDKTVLGTGTLSGGSASFTSALLKAGTDSIKAEYGGDPNFAASTSKTVSQVVSKAATSTVLVSSENPSSYGQPVTFTAAVTPQFGGTPTGSVAFYNGTAKLGTGKLSSGVASYTTTKLAVGTESITAQYEGSTSFDSSTSAALNQTVNPAGETTTRMGLPPPGRFSLASREH